MAEGLRLEDWIGKMVTVNLHRGQAATPNDELISIEGFLQGVDPSGIILLFDPMAVSGKRGRARSRPEDATPRYVFYPWRRVELIERIEEAEE